MWCDEYVVEKERRGDLSLPLLEAVEGWGGGAWLWKDGALLWNYNQHRVTICPMSDREREWETEIERGRERKKGKESWIFLAFGAPVSFSVSRVPNRSVCLGLTALSQTMWCVCAGSGSARGRAQPDTHTPSWTALLSPATHLSTPP